MLTTSLVSIILWKPEVAGVRVFNADRESFARLGGLSGLSTEPALLDICPSCEFSGTTEVAVSWGMLLGHVLAMCPATLQEKQTNSSYDVNIR